MYFGRILRNHFGAVMLALLATGVSSVVSAGPANPLTQAVWVHGNAVVLEHPDRVRQLSKGANTRLTQVGTNNSTWVHFVVPTPVIISDKRQKLHSVMVRYRGDPKGYNQDSILNTSYVRDVHVWDGNRRIYTSGYLGARANVSHDEPFDRFELPAPMSLNFGVVISLLVDFGEGDWIEFDSVGVDFTQ